MRFLFSRRMAKNNREVDDSLNEALVAWTRVKVKALKWKLWIDVRLLDRFGKQMQWYFAKRRLDVCYKVDCIFNEETLRKYLCFVWLELTAPKIVRENSLFAETTTKQSRRIKRERIQNTDTIVCYHLVVVKQITRESYVYSILHERLFGYDRSR